MRKDPRGKIARSVQENSPYIALGWQLAATIVFFVGAGYGLDLWLGTRPWLTLTGAVLGITSFFALIYKLVRTLEAEDRRRKQVKKSLK